MTRKKRLALRAEEKRQHRHHLREFVRAVARSKSIDFYVGFQFIRTRLKNKPRSI